MSEQEYRDLFNLLGRPLERRDAISDEEIAEAESDLECRIPAALRAFYRVAGRAVDFIERHDQFLPPDEWWVDDDGKLVFVTENQAVVLYAIDTEIGSEDPPVLIASNRDVLVWNEVCGRCSEFLKVMVCWEGAFGGAMHCVGTAIVDETFRQTIERHFRLRGEVNSMRAFTRPGAAVCFVQWNDGWRIFLGAATKGEALAAIDDLGVELEINE